jgi:hypothetical protein
MMGVVATTTDLIPTDARRNCIHISDTMCVGILNEISADGIGMAAASMGSPVEVWVLVADGVLRCCWDPGGKFTVSS